MKPSEQRAPLLKMASPPERKGLNSPAVFSIRAIPLPSDLTVDFTVASSAAVTVLSTVTWISLVFGSTAQAVPGILACAFNVFAAPASSAVVFCTLLATAPAFSTWTTTLLSSPLTTLMITWPACAS